MKLTILRRSLLDAVVTALGAVSARTPKPILSCLLISADDPKKPVTVYGSDLEVSVLAEAPGAEVEKTGRAVVNAQLLKDVLKACSDDQVQLEVAGDHLHVRTVSDHLKLFGNDPNDFVGEPELGGEVKTIILPPATLKSMLQRTKFAASREATEQNTINAVFFEVEGKKLRCIATDGRRMALVATDLEAPAAKEIIAALVPTKAINLVDDIPDGSPDGDPKIEIRIGTNRALFIGPGVTIGTSLLEGDFPPYRDVLPKAENTGAHVATLDRDSFAAAVHRASLFQDGEGKRGLEFSFSKKGLTMRAKDPTVGEGIVNLSCTFKGNDLKIAFDGRFMSEGIKHAQADELAFEMTEPKRPGLMRGGDDYLYLVMPMG